MKQIVALLLIFITFGCYDKEKLERDSESDSMRDTESELHDDTDYPEHCVERDSDQCELDTECKNLMGYYMMEHDGMVYSCRSSYRQIECVNFSKCDSEEIAVRSEIRGCWIAANYCDGETDGWTTESLEENCPVLVHQTTECK